MCLHDITLALVDCQGERLGLDSGDMAPNDPMTRAYAATCGDLKTAVTTWTALNGNELTTFNGVLVKNSLKLIPAATPVLAGPACGAGTPPPASAR